LCACSVTSRSVCSAPVGGDALFRVIKVQESATTSNSELRSAVCDAIVKAREWLLAQRNDEGIWEGRLSSSALSTATAVVALDLFQQQQPSASPRLVELAERGRWWLARNINADGGWGDTVQSKSNISTTTLVWAALKNAARSTTDAELLPAVTASEQWLTRHAGGLEPDCLAEKILERYGSDRTFSAPILTHCALAGRMGLGPQAWRRVIPLPFELAAFPARWFGALRLPVVSYALPALIAIGYARHHHAPSRNPISRFVRSLATERVLRVLETIQPGNGGFLEAIPLTSFVVMSLAGSGRANHPVACRGIDFIIQSVQPDGSWKIDTNLSTFVSTLATHALSLGGTTCLPAPDRAVIQAWLLQQQYQVFHPYTNAAPGGWAWTPLPGGVPDADDTAGALVALKALNCPGPNVISAAECGVTWLLNLQNSNGGIPTFCRGWGKLPFDRSSADITAHALRAWAAWRSDLPALARRIDSAKHRALQFLTRSQEPSGAWAPLWFGNEFESDELNRVYGTSRVLLALVQSGEDFAAAQKALKWLVRVQKADGGWTGGEGPGDSSTEETGVAIEALCAVVELWPELLPSLENAIHRGLSHLLSQIANASWTNPAPIGFYFAKLWYFEKLYPGIFALAALERGARVLEQLPV
jgi:squalene-hopene/tetraprenyl-beta-curcumene cyclase